MPALRFAFIFSSLLIVVVASSPAIAQKGKVIGGSLEGLKGQKSYAVEFNYDSMMVGRDETEKTYLERKRKDWEEKEAGKGTAFVAQWFDDRKKRYEPAFVKGFEGFSKIKIDQGSKYTLIVKTRKTEGGWNVGPSHPGLISGEMWVVESANHGHLIARIAFSNLAGTDAYGSDFNMTHRIASAYEFAGKFLGDYLKRKSK